MLKDFSKEKFDIIIQAGQSNAEGNGMGDVEKAYQQTDDVWFMCGALDSHEFYLCPAHEGVRENEVLSNFIFKFAENYVADNRLKDGRKLLILCAAVGGTGFIKGQWKMTDCYYLRMMEMIRTALSLNPENRLVGFLWHQGESDAISGGTFDGHYNNLQTLFNSVRDEFNVPEIPFIAGDFVQDWSSKNTDICKPVVNAVRKICNDYHFGAFVESDGLNSNLQEFGCPTPALGTLIEDDIHFSRGALYELGERYYKAFSEISKS